MKNLIALLVFLFFAIFLAAQNIERTFQEDDFHTLFSTSISPIGNGSILVGGQVNDPWDGDYPSAMFWFNEQDGEFTSDWIFSEIEGRGMIENSFVADDFNILLIINQDICDDGVWKSIININSAGGWSKQIGGDLGEKNSAMFVTETNEVVVVADTLLYEFTLDGITLLDKKGISVLAMDVSKSDSLGYLTVGQGGLSQLKDLVETIHFEDYNFWRIRKDINDTLFLLHENGLLKANSQFEIVDSMSFEFEHQFKRMTIDDDFIYLFGIDSFERVVLQIFDKAFNFQNEIHVGNKNIIPTEIKVDSSKVYLTGIYAEAFLMDSTNVVETSFNSFEENLFNASRLDYGSYWFQIMEKNNIQAFERPDIAMLDISSDLVEIDSNSNQSGYQLTFYDLKVKVKNTGNIPIVTANINGFPKSSSQVVFCYYPAQEFYTRNVTINPNEEFEISFGDYIINTNQPNDYELCLWTSSPDGLADDDYSNNYFCKTFSPITSSENFPFSQKIKLFPNPANELLSVELPDDLVNEKVAFEIFNTQGQLVQQYFSENKKIEHLDVQSLTNGIYFIKFTQENGNSFLKRFVITK